MMKREKEEAFIEAVRDGSPKMYRVALGFLHSPQDAQDAVSDAIEAAWKNLGRIRFDQGGVVGVVGYFLVFLGPIAAILFIGYWISRMSEKRRNKAK